MDTELLGKGIYSPGEAGRLTGLSPQRISAWFGKRDSRRSRVFQSDFGPISGDLRISFHDLIDSLVAGKLREKGVSLQTIRKVYAKLTQEYGDRHPFCRRELLTDGRKVFLSYANHAEDQYLVDLVHDQHVFPAVLYPYLERIDYDPKSSLAQRWHIQQGIVVDPKRSLGKPIVERSGIPTHTLATAYEANQHDTELVAEWFSVSVDEVADAVRFETTSAKNAA